ncbi:hypothetical protein [Variovorax sp. PBL-H6]|uniref:hypothetical protein n=1 Tax=Variovorax sp. PBL-H6 TaxID=434009 RepID=UPI003FCD77D6
MQADRLARRTVRTILLAATCAMTSSCPPPVLDSAVEGGHSDSTRSYTRTCLVRANVAQRRFSMKIILWIIGIIFLIGLLTVLGVGKLIF